jgi:hypothetical protein
MSTLAKLDIFLAVTKRYARRASRSICSIPLKQNGGTSLVHFSGSHVHAMAVKLPLAYVAKPI